MSAVKVQFLDDFTEVLLSEVIRLSR